MWFPFYQKHAIACVYHLSGSRIAYIWLIRDLLKWKSTEGLKCAVEVAKRLNLDNLRPVEGMLLERDSNGIFTLISPDRSVTITDEWLNNADPAWAAKIDMAMAQIRAVEEKE